MHFIYEENQPTGADLRQGDILAKTPEMVDLLAAFHPHYSSSRDYVYLMVLTQSCDLARQPDDKTCKSRYITLAAVRPVEKAIEHELAKYQYSDFERQSHICLASSAKYVDDFFRRLLNNNNPEYFYLPLEPTIRIELECVAFLKLSVAIRSEHYELCLNARLARLQEVFQAKLGWLVGNLYSRVGTRDWTPDYCSQDEFDQLVQEKLKDAAIWVDDKETLDLLKKEQDELRVRLNDPGHVMSLGELETIVTARPSKKAQKKKKIVDAVVETVSTTLSITPPEALKLRNLLTSDSKLASLLR